MCAFLWRSVPVVAVHVLMARIRNLTETDIHAAVELLVAESSLSPPYATESWREFVELYLGRDVLFLAEEDSLLSGLVCFYPAPILAYGGYVQFLVVRPEMRGRGIARQLLGFVERMVFKRTADMYFCVPSANESAIKFLEKMGYARDSQISASPTVPLEWSILRKSLDSGGLRRRIYRQP